MEDEQDPQPQSQYDPEAVVYDEEDENVLASEEDSRSTLRKPSGRKRVQPQVYDLL